jgi:hypothetical protein
MGLHGSLGHVQPIATSESAPQELSNEWSCQNILTILNVLGNFCVPSLMTKTTVSSSSNMPK